MPGSFIRFATNGYNNQAVGICTIVCFSNKSLDTKYEIRNAIPLLRYCSRCQAVSSYGQCVPRALPSALLNKYIAFSIFMMYLVISITGCAFFPPAAMDHSCTDVV